MCKMSDYSGLYMKTAENLRHEGIKQDMPGFELLRKAIVICKIEGIDDILDKIQNETLIPDIKPVITEKSPAEQWMVEAIRSVGISVSVISFIEDMANML